MSTVNVAAMMKGNAMRNRRTQNIYVFSLMSTMVAQAEFPIQVTLVFSTVGENRRLHNQSPFVRLFRWIACEKAILRQLCQRKRNRGVQVTAS
jgi:hypothetical protein